MNRRNFLRTGSAFGLPLLLNGLPVRALGKSALLPLINEDNDRVLVLIQLNGGNDGLSTVLPLDQYSALAAARSNVLIPESQGLALTDTTALHPAMTGIKNLFDDGRLGIVRGVGYPDQNRSHFRSTDIWTSGSAATENKTTGWLGSNFQRTAPTFPDGYPSADRPDPFAITMGSNVSATCMGEVANFSIALTDPFNISALPEAAQGPAPDTPYGRELTYLRTVIEQSNAYGDSVTAAAGLGANTVDYPDTPLGQQLKNVALLIAGGLRTKVYVCSLGGFDTHANQVAGDSTTTGEHATLLATLADAVAAFQADVAGLGLSERVLGMTFSEFGRRIKSNNSLGTDHGSAAPLLLFGSCVTPGLTGTNPEIPANVGTQDGVAMQYDFRDVYGTVLEDWFGVAPTEIQQLLYADYQHLPILQVCGTTDAEELAPAAGLQIVPNPTPGRTQLRFTHPGGYLSARVYNLLAHEVAVLAERTLPSGAHTLEFDARRLPAGNYYALLRFADGSRVSRAISVVR